MINISSESMPEGNEIVYNIQGAEKKNSSNNSISKKRILQIWGGCKTIPG